MTESIRARLDREAVRLDHENAIGNPDVTADFISGFRRAMDFASFARRAAASTAQAADFLAWDKQVVHVRAEQFTALVNSGLDTRELDRALAVLGIVMVIDQ